MSKAEFERFTEELAADPALQAEAKAAATGLAALVAFAMQRGYDVTLDDAASHIKARAPQQMSGEELDTIAGGAGAPDGVVITSVSNVVISNVMSNVEVSAVANTSTNIAQIVVIEAVCSGAVAVT